jgi:hypothetical protein
MSNRAHLHGVTSLVRATTARSTFIILISIKIQTFYCWDAVEFHAPAISVSNSVSCCILRPKIEGLPCR